MEYSSFQTLSSNGIDVSNIIVFGAILIAMILIAGAVWHSWTVYQIKCRNEHPKTKAIDHMYYKIKYSRSKKSEQMEVGYLLSLSAEEATMIVNGGETLEKGDNLFLAFDKNAPGSSELHQRSFARIRKLQRVSNTSSWYIYLHFVDMEKNPIDLVQKPIKR